jgi:hypothetical protein
MFIFKWLSESFDRVIAAFSGDDVNLSIQRMEDMTEPVEQVDTSVALIKSTHSSNNQVQFDFDQREFERHHPGWLEK